MINITIHADGCCLANPGGPGGWGAVVQIAGDPEPYELSGHLPETTNNRAELLAVIRPLEVILVPAAIIIVSDSRYVIDGMTKWRRRWQQNGWRTRYDKPLANIDLWQELDALACHPWMRWEWVRGHAGHPLNERADALAEAASWLSDQELAA